MSGSSPFRYIKASPETIRRAFMMHVRFQLSLRNVEEKRPAPHWQGLAAKFCFGLI
jgi:hypothetical protein